MAFKNVHHSWKMLETVTRGDAHFSMTYLGSELNHTLFRFGHLNVIKYFKCPNNLKPKCFMLDIFYTVGMSSLMIFDSAWAFLEKPQTSRKKRKTK